jgi:hypothetical protein
MSNAFAISGMILFPVLSLFFWVRGLVRASIGDMVAGLAILLFISAGILIVLRDSRGFDIAGGILIVFGRATLGARPFAKDQPPVKRRDLIPAGILFIVVGAFGVIVV